MLCLLRNGEKNLIKFAFTYVPSIDIPFKEVLLGSLQLGI